MRRWWTTRSGGRLRPPHARTAHPTAARVACTSSPRPSASGIRASSPTRQTGVGPGSARQDHGHRMGVPGGRAARRRWRQPRLSPRGSTWLWRRPWSRRCSHRCRPVRHRLLHEIGVAVLFEFECQALVTRADNPTSGHDMDLVGDDVVEEPLMMGDDDHGPIRTSHGVHPAGDDPEGIDVEAGVGLVQDGELRLENCHLQNLVALLLTPGETLVDRPAHEALVHLDELHPLPSQGKESHYIEFIESSLPTHRIERHAQEVQVAHPGDLHRVLEGEEEAGRGTVLGRQGEQVLVLEADRAGDAVGLVAGKHVGEGALARAVRAHDGVYFARRNFEVDSPEDLVVTDLGVEVLDLQHHPTLPSRLTLRSLWASTANSMGNSLKTSRQKPFTIMETASSSEIPRWRQ